MKRSKQKPPIYDRLVEKFGINWSTGIIITYGDTVHCRYKISNAKVAHEKTHIKQQAAYGVEAWWDRYIEDPAFRLSQEIEAYRNELNWIASHIHDLRLKRTLTDDILRDLSGYIYGNLVTVDQARKLLSDNK